MHRCLLAGTLAGVVTLAGAAGAQNGARGTQTTEIAIRVSQVSIGPRDQRQRVPLTIGLVVENRLAQDLYVAAYPPQPELLPGRGSCDPGATSLRATHLPRDRSDRNWSAFTRIQAGSTHGMGLSLRFSCSADVVGATAQLSFGMALGVAGADAALPDRAVVLQPTVTGIELAQR